MAPNSCANDVVGANISLINGDCDGDNTIAQNDKTVLNAAWGKRKGQAGYSDMADLDGNGAVQNLAGWTATWTAVALVVSYSTLARALVNFVVTVSRPEFPTKMFDTVEDARSWARTHVHGG